MKLARHTHQHHTSGFSVIEVLLGVALFAVFAAAMMRTAGETLDANARAADFVVATQYGQQGVEAVRSIAKQDFANLTNSTGTGITQSGGVWTLSGSNNAFNGMTRTLAVADVARDGSGDIVSSGGTTDGNTKLVTSTVEWTDYAGITKSIELRTYLTNWVLTLSKDWTQTLSAQSTLDLAGSDDGWKVAVAGSYAYVVRSGGSPDFYVIDISDSTNASIVGSTSLSGNPTDVAVSGNYAYVSSDGDELVVVDISSPASPNQSTTLDLTGAADGTTVAVSGNRAYVGRTGNDELHIIDISTPTSPSPVASLSVSGTVNSLAIKGNYAYLATDGVEFQIVDISGTPNVVGSVDIGGGNNAESVWVDPNADYAYVGRANGNVYAIDISSPNSPTQLNNYDVGQTANDLVLNADGSLLFVGNNTNGTELTVLDTDELINAGAGILLNTFAAAGDIFGVAYHSGDDSVVAVGNDNSQEFLIISP